MVLLKRKILRLEILAKSFHKSMEWTRLSALCKRKSQSSSTITQVWKAMSELLKRISDFQPIKTTKSFNSWTNTKIKSLQMIKKTVFWNKKSTIWWKKTLTSTDKWGLPRKISDFQQIKCQRSSLNSTITKIKSTQTIKNQKHTGPESKNSSGKIILWMTKSSKFKKTCDFQLLKWENSKTSSKSSVTKMNNSREDWPTTTMPQRKSTLKEKTRSESSARSAKDLTVSLRRKTMKFEPLEVRSRSIKKVSDFQQPNYLSSDHSSMTIKTEWELRLRSPKPTSSEFRSFCQKILVWVTKSGLLKKTWDSRLDK